MRVQKKAGFWEGSPEVCAPKGLVLPIDTPNPRAKLRGDPMTPTLVLRAAGSLLLRAVRRLTSSPQPAAPQSLTIGAIQMNQQTPEPPAIPGGPTSRRSLGYQALLALADDLLIARFALTRALDRLQTEDLLQVLDEVDETADRQPRRPTLRVVTPRDENE